MTNEINNYLTSIGLKATAFPVNQYVVVPMGCDTWTFQPDHLMDMIKEVLRRYL